MKKAVAVFILGCICQLTLAENVCSPFCSSLGMVQSNPGKSCDDIYQINKASRGQSGDYWVISTGVRQVYCDMELECGGHKGGWMKIADFDISKGGNCPSGWAKITNFAGCRSTSSNAGCDPIFFSVHGMSYSKICGKARGYTTNSPDGFHGITQTNHDINGAYVDGLSITTGNPRKHIWTYAATAESGRCPCYSTDAELLVATSSIVGDDYYCEVGSSFNVGRPLWDGIGCTLKNDNCCSIAGMPWFFRQLPISQIDNVEVRICRNEDYSNEAIAIDQLQLFVK